MRIILTEHAKKRAKERGATIEEIEEVLMSSKEIETMSHNRKIKEKIFEFNNKWLGTYYPQKKVRVIYTEENNDIISILW